MFAAIAFPVFIWSITNVLHELPAWVLRLTIWDLMGMFAYTQMFALFETLLVLTALLLMAAILPGRIFRDRFVSVGTILIVISSLWAIAYHRSGIDPSELGARELAAAGLAYVASVVLAWAVVNRFDRLRIAIRTVVDRVSVLALLYAGIGVAGLLVVLIRNL